jgi:hypothetical protein
MNTARLLVPIFTLQVFLYLLLDFLLAGYFSERSEVLPCRFNVIVIIGSTGENQNRSACTKA